MEREKSLTYINAKQLFWKSFEGSGKQQHHQASEIDAF
jgi:hypothetical protein